MSFLKAEWRKLLMINYRIDPMKLKDYVPYGTELDVWEDECYVSLIGFMFLNTKLLGIKIPFHTNFEEVNLRFYVRRKEGNAWKRGVVFIKEIVPKWALTFVANTLYNEKYVTKKMKHNWEFDEHDQYISYSWLESGNWQNFEVKAELKGNVIEKGSLTEFITEHYWGYAKVNDRRTNEYEVTHPVWETYNVLDHEVNVDFGKVYGSNFSFLNEEKIAFIFLAEGSNITVEGKNVIE